MSKIKTPVLVGVLLLLTACTTIPLGTMLKMVRLNPLDMDPQQLVVAVKTPEGLNVQDGDVVVNFTFRTGDPNTSFEHQFPVMVNADYVIPESLKRDLKANESITVLQLSEEDARTMYEGQQAVKNYRLEHENGGAGNIDIDLVSACREESFSWRDSRLNVYLKTNDEEDFFLFMRNLDVTNLSDEAEDEFEALPSCAA